MRATIRGGRLTLVPEEHAMVEGGPLAVLTRAALPADVSIATLTIDEEEPGDQRELEVEFLVNDTTEARDTLKDWAALTRHALVWFSDEIHEPAEPDVLEPEVRTTCETCGLEMRDGSQGFWELVVSCGFFPPCCFACGASVPQWVPVPARPRNARERRLDRIRLVRELDAGAADDPSD